MANALYHLARQAFLEGGVAWLADNIKADLIDTTAYTPNLATDEFLAIIPAPAIVATSVNFTTKTSVDGVADADNLMYPAVVGPVVEALVIYQDTGVPATSRLIAFIDNAIGLPATPTGSPVSVIWDNGPLKIFKL